MTAPHFVSVNGTDRLGQLLFAGRAELPTCGGGISGDGLWREQGRSDDGTLFLLIDIEGHGPPTSPLREIIELALDDPSAWNLPPSELLIELHSQGVIAWADTPRRQGKYFHAQAVLIVPDKDHFLLASAGIPNPYFALAGESWQVITAPHQSITMLGWPDLHDDDGPVFPDRRFDLTGRCDSIACTDGITDLGRKDGLRPAAVVEMLNALAERPDPEELLAEVFALAAKHDGASWPGDDSTGVAWRIE